MIGLTIKIDLGNTPELKRLALRGGNTSQSLDNNASYASLVQGRKQIPYHKGTGWKTVETVLREERANVARIIAIQTAQKQPLMVTARTVLVHLRSKLAPYPPRSSRPQAHLWTRQQRREFFAKLRAGEIEVPYRRGQSPGSENLGKRWRIRA